MDFQNINLVNNLETYLKTKYFLISKLEDDIIFLEKDNLKTKISSKIVSSDDYKIFELTDESGIQLNFYVTYSESLNKKSIIELDKILQKIKVLISHDKKAYKSIIIVVNDIDFSILDNLKIKPEDSLTVSELSANIESTMFIGIHRIQMIKTKEAQDIQTLNTECNNNKISTESMNFNIIVKLFHIGIPFSGLRFFYSNHGTGKQFEDKFFKIRLSTF